MKRINGRLILRLVLMGMGVTGLVATLAQCGGGASPGPGIRTEPAAPTLMHVPTEAVLPTPPPALAPYRLSAATEVALPTDRFRLQGLYDDTAIGIIGEGVESQVVIVDLITGQMQQISSAVDTIYKASARISGRWAVWIESIRTPEGGWEDRLKGYDLEQKHEFQLDVVPSGVGVVDIWGDVVVWTEYAPSSTFPYYCQESVLAQNLTTGQQWTVATGLFCAAFPRISETWVIYMKPGENWDEIKDQKYGWYLDLRAHHLDTGEDLLVGQVPCPNDASAGTHYAIAGSKVVWIKYQPKPGLRYETELRVYDLETRTDRPLVLSDGRRITSFLELFGDNALLVGRTTIYSLEDGDLLGAIDTSALEGDLTGVYVSGNRVVLTTEQEGPSGRLWRLYTLQLGR